MKVKIFRTVLATVMCTMLLGLQVSASGLSDAIDTTERDIEGTSGLEEPIFRVVVPMALDFALDPFEQRESSQIYSANYPIINKSNVNVNVNVALTLESEETNVDDEIVFLPSADAVNSLAWEDDSKSIYIAAAVPASTDAISEVAETADYTNWGSNGLGYIGITSAGPGEDPVVVAVPGAALADMKTAAEAFAQSTSGLGYTGSLTSTDANAQEITLTDEMDLANADTYVEVPLSTTSTSLSFYLAKAEYQDYISAADSSEGKVFKAMAADEKGSTFYRFIGAVNSQANWVIGEVTAKATYSFKGAQDDRYNAIEFAGHGLEESGILFDEEGVSDFYKSAGLVYLGTSYEDSSITDVDAVSNIRVSVDGGKANAITEGKAIGSGFLTITTEAFEDVAGTVDDTKEYVIYFTMDSKTYKATMVIKD